MSKSDDIISSEDVDAIKDKFGAKAVIIIAYFDDERAQGAQVVARGIDMDSVATMISTLDDVCEQLCSDTVNFVKALRKDGVPSPFTKDM